MCCPAIISFCVALLFTAWGCDIFRKKGEIGGRGEEGDRGKRNQTHTGNSPKVEASQSARPGREAGFPEIMHHLCDHTGFPSALAATRGGVREKTCPGPDAPSSTSVTQPRSLPEKSRVRSLPGGVSILIFRGFPHLLSQHRHLSASCRSSHQRPTSGTKGGAAATQGMSAARKSVEVHLSLSTEPMSSGVHVRNFVSPPTNAGHAPICVEQD